MVHVKSVREYELHQDLIVLFSETLQRAIKNGMVTQDQVDLYEPSLMFAIPRLAIVYGLLISPDGPLNVDRSSADFPELFLPFKNLLRKIRELLLTLAQAEIMVLEMLLCQQEEPANIANKLKEVERRLESQEISEMQAKPLQDKLSCHPEKQLNPHKICDKIVDDIIGKAVERAEEQKCRVAGESVIGASKDVDDANLMSDAKQLSDSKLLSDAKHVEIDCTDPEIKVTSPPSQGASSSSSTSTYSPRPRQRLKRHNAKRDSRRIPLRYQKDRRAKFKSTEDLLHRLYVCISGAADQLQSNYAGDFR